MPPSSTSSSNKQSQAASAPAKSALGSFSPRILLNMFLERWWIGLIVGALACTAFILVQPKPQPVYYTEVKILFEPQKEQVIGVREVVDSNVSSSLMLNLQVAKMQSTSFYDYFQNSFTAKEIEEIQRPYKDPLNPTAPPPALSNIIRSAINIQQERNTTIIKVGITNKDPENAALIANRFAKRFMEYNVDDVESRTNSAIIWLQKQAEEKRKEVEKLEAEKQTYRERHNMAALGETKNIIQQKVGLLGSELARIQVEQTTLSSQIESIDNYRASGKNILELSSLATLSNAAAHQGAIDNLRAQRRLLEERYGDAHPRMRENQISLENAERQLNTSIELAVAEIKARLHQAQEHETRLRKDYAEAELQAQQLDKTNLEYDLLERDSTSAQNNLQTVITRLNETTMVSQLNNASIKIHDRAPVPYSPSSGTPKEVIMQAIGMGVILLFGIPLGLGFIDTRIKTSHDIESGLNQVMLGGIKSMQNLNETERANVFRLHKDEAINEAYRGVFSEIEVRSTVVTPKRILITSSIPGEGKSLTAANLSAVFAAHGKKTLLIDCDLRRPSLRRYFSAEAGVGLLPWLRKHGSQADIQITPADLGVTSIAPNFDLLTAGDSTKNPTEIIDQIAHTDLFNKLSKHYDIILIDTPPSAVFPDALLLSRFCAELIYVCRFKTIRKSVISKSLSKFMDSGISPLGVVLNCVPQSSVMNYGYEGYGAYHSDYYKSYHGESEEKS